MMLIILLSALHVLSHVLLCILVRPAMIYHDLLLVSTQAVELPVGVVLPCATLIACRPTDGIASLSEFHHICEWIMNGCMCKG